MSKSLKSCLFAVCCLLGPANAFADGDRGDRGRGDYPRLWSYDREDDRRSRKNRASADQRGQDNQASAAQTGEANESRVKQEGDQNRGTVTQTGEANLGSIRQIGFGNNAGIAQNGSYNTACLIQIGRRLDGGVVQNGNGNSSGIIQTRKGAQEIPAELCLVADHAIGQVRQSVARELESMAPGLGFFR